MESKDKSNSEINKTSSGRRDFLKKGAIVTAPVVVTAWARPVHALRCGLSGLLSSNLSYRPERDTCEMGKSPGFWGRQGATFGYWPSEVNYTGGEVTAFTGVRPDEWINFPPFHGPYLYGFSGGEYGDADMLQILHEYENTEAQQFVAALLNSYSSLVNYPLTPQDVMYIWSVKDSFATLNPEGKSANDFLESLHEPEE